MQYRRDIDGLRSIAVVPVVLFHAGMPGFSGGYIGVDVFFVISGFLITSIVAREIGEARFSLLSFYERRARRILPALAAVLVASLAAGWLLLMPSELERLGRSTLATVLFASNFHFARSLDYFAAAAEFEPLLHTWSLAVEEQFYLFFPPLLMALAWLRQSRHMLAAVAAISAVSLAASVAALGWKPDWVFYIIVFRAWELGAGAMLALAGTAPPSSRAAREALGIGGLLAILGPVVLYTNTTPFPGLAALPPVLGATVLIWIGREGGGSLANRLLAMGPLVAIGLISYSLYLWHWPILAYLRVLEGSVKLPALVAAGAVAASVLAAWLSYRFVEQPFRKHPPKGFGRGAIFAMSAASIVLLGAVGETLFQAGGVPQRLSREATLIAATVEDRNPRRPDCLARDPADGLCTFGMAARDGGKPTFLLWGDSHGDMIMPGVDQAARAAGRTGHFAGKVGCAPLTAIDRTPPGLDCAAHAAATWAWLQQNEDIDLVILAARWTIMVESERYGGEGGSRMELRWIGDPARRPESAENPALLEAALKDTVDKIVASGRKVVLVGPVPEVGRDVPIDTARRKMLGLPRAPDLSVADFTARAGRTEAILRRVADSSPQVRYIAMSDLFCQGGICRTLAEDGTPLYVDDDHISATTARTLLLPRLENIWAAGTP